MLNCCETVGLLRGNGHTWLPATGLRGVGEFVEVLCQQAEFTVEVEKRFKGPQRNGGLVNVCRVEADCKAGLGACFKPMIGLFVKASLDSVVLVEDDHLGRQATLFVI